MCRPHDTTCTKPFLNDRGCGLNTWLRRIRGPDCLFLVADDAFFGPFVQSAHPMEHSNATADDLQYIPILFKSKFVDPQYFPLLLNTTCNPKASPFSEASTVPYRVHCAPGMQLSGGYARHDTVGLVYTGCSRSESIVNTQRSQRLLSPPVFVGFASSCEPGCHSRRV